MSGIGASNRFSVVNENLALLADTIRKDPGAYKEEFLQRLSHYNSLVNILHLDPENMDDQQNNDLIDVVNFMTVVAHHYGNDAKLFAESLLSVLDKSAQLLPPPVRLSFCKALVALRNRDLASPVQTLSLFLDLVKCQDKELRKFIFSSIVSYLKRINAHKKDQKLNSSLQQFIYAKLKDSRSVVVRTSLLLLIDAYRRNIWSDARTANALAECCFHKTTRIQVAALKFFLGAKDGEQDNLDGSDSESEQQQKGNDKRTVKQVMLGYRVGRKTNKRKRQMEIAKKQIGKEVAKKRKNKFRNECNLRACQQLYDPQAFAERLQKRIESPRAEKFEVRLLCMALVAKLIGLHKLQVLSFYSFIQRYLKPQQREVTHILLYAAQSCHEMVPPDVIESLLRCLANNFVTDRNSPEAITVGLNTVREILANCPFAVDEDLLRDFAEYKKYKNKNVAMAARGIIQLYRIENPTLLRRRDRGQKSLAVQEHEPAHFGVPTAKPTIEGAEVLLKKSRQTKKSEHDSTDETKTMTASAANELEPDSDNEHDEHQGQSETGSGDEDIESGSEPGSDDDQWETDSEMESGDDADDQPIGAEPDTNTNQSASSPQTEPANEQQAIIDLLSSGEILDDADFKRIQRYQLSKHAMPASSARKRKTQTNAKLSDSDSDDSSNQSDGESSDSEDANPSGLTSLSRIEHMHKKPRRANKAERLATVMEGREGREKFGRPKPKGSHVGRTNTRLARNKNFMMVKQKKRGEKRQRSFFERQRSMKNALKQQQGRKR